MKLAEIFALVAGPESNLEFIAYDGSRAGTPGADIQLELKSPRGVSLVLSSPGQLGLARAYIAGELELHGTMYDALSQLADVRLNHLTRRDKLRLVRALAPYATSRKDIVRPVEEIDLDGSQHSKNRDAKAISAHYDVSNAFYELVLGSSMVYTCAVYPTLDATLEQAQEEKLDLVCRKLGLRPGMRLLDIGCGWGSMVLHAVKNYGVTAIGVTLSEQQALYAQQRIADAGLEGQAQVRFQDYRDVPESGFDAISSIGLTEHIGQKNYPAYFKFLRSRLRPGGRLLNHTITRTDPHAKTQHRKGFINRYVFPDGELVAASRVMSVLEDEGLEIRHEENLREHYAMTLRDWCKNLDDRWDEAVEEIGEPKARIWRLYMAASRLGFELNWIQLHQVLATRTEDDGDAHVPLRPWF